VQIHSGNASSLAPLKALAISESYQQFDAAVRESYGDPENFKQAFGEYAKAQKLSDRALELSQARDYLAAACELSDSLLVKREALVAQLNFEPLFNSPHLIGARLDSIKQWKEDYVQAYRRGHRAHYEALAQLAAAADGLRSRAIALSRLNAVAELGPPLPGTADIMADFERLQKALWVCSDAPEAEVAGANAICPKCQWTAAKSLPQPQYDRLAQAVAFGLAGTSR